MADYVANGINGDYMLYRGKPLVRNDNLYCYGDMDDDYILFLMVLTTKKPEVGNSTEEIPDQILVQILSTDQSLSPSERLAKQFEKKGLYDAIDIGLIWLDKLNRK